MKRSNNSTLLFILTSSLILFYLSDLYQIFGKAVNYFFPCVQNIANSFPCYAIIDVWAMGILMVIGFGSLIIMLINMYRIYFKK